MAVVSVEPRPVTATTAKQTENGTEYDVVYFVKTDSMLDGPATVLAASGLPQFWDPYSLGNDSDPESFLREMEPVPLSDTKWEVTCRYKPLVANEEEEEPFENPLNAPPQVEIGFQQFTKPVERAIFRILRGDVGKGTPEGDDPARVQDIWTLGHARSPIVHSGEEVIPCNSSGEIFDPHLEKDDSRLIIRITRNEASFNTGYLDYINTCNADWVTITSGGLNVEFLSRELKMQDIQASRQTITRKIKGAAGHQRITFWTITFELAAKPLEALFRGGWYAETLDAGYSVRAIIGRSDGAEGTILANEVQNFPAGGNPHVPHRMGIHDPRLGYLSTPAFLDGKGAVLEPQPSELDPEGPQLRKHVWISWEIYPLRVFNTLGL